jgi:hypothetical protein
VEKKIILRGAPAGMLAFVFARIFGPLAERLFGPKENAREVAVTG